MCHAGEQADDRGLFTTCNVMRCKQDPLQACVRLSDFVSSVIITKVSPLDMIFRSNTTNKPDSQALTIHSSVYSLTLPRTTACLLCDLELPAVYCRQQ